MMTSAQILSHLFSLNTRGIKYDLDRMRKAAVRLHNPQHRVPCFHIAGTNGKGSVCTYIESALRACGHRTGLFTSPHLVRFEERFMINGAPVDESKWLAVYRDLQQVIDEMELTFFEATTLLAFELFRREKVDWAVYETGLGGRLDATNVVTPRVSVITHLALDHAEYLGPDIGSVAREKLGIVKPGVPLVMAEPDENEVRSLALATCAAMDATCTFAGPADARDITVDGDGVVFAWEGQRYRVNLRGAYQLNNALIALNALKAAGFKDTQKIAAGLADATLHGRFQTAALRGKTVVFDVGHNPDAATEFSAALEKRFPGKSVCMVTGIMKDKDSAGILAQYGRIAARIILTEPAGAAGRAAKPGELEKNLPADFTGEHSLKATIPEAIDAAFSSPEEIVCIAGSFFTVGEGMEYLKIVPYK